MYAPAAVFGYNRKDHLEKTLLALEQNKLAAETELYIFSDGSRSEKDKEAVQEVRSFLKEYEKRQTFKRITVCAAEKNKGLAGSIISGVSELIEKYGKVIVLEDDLLTAVDFLEYMNHALDFYEEDERIWSVTGYTLPLKRLKEYSEDVYVSYRASSWAWGTWKDRWETVDWEVKDFDKLCRSKEMQKQLNRGGREMFQMLKDWQAGKNNSWAIRWCYSQSKQDKFTIHPKYCKARNIGGDGTGENSLATKKYLTEIDHTPIEIKKVKPDKKILKEFRDYYRLTMEEVWVLGMARVKRDMGKIRKR